MANISSSNSLGENVPKLRFPDTKGNFFTDYTHNTLRGLFTRITQRNTEGITNVITNSAEHGLIPQRDFFDKDIAVDGNTSNYYVIKPGDFVYNPRKSNQAPYGPFNCYNYMDEGIVSPLYTCLRPQIKEYTEFLLWYFKSPVWHSYIYHTGAQGGARHDRVGMTTELMEGIPINLPEINEQQKIVSFLNLIERKINIQCKLVECLKLYKRGLLAKLFPQKGESVPRYRFEGFTDDWEQRKAADIAEYSKGNGYSKSDLTEVGTPIILYGRLYTKYQFAIDEVDTFVTPKNGAVYSQGNEVIIPASGETAEDIARASAVGKPGVLLGGDLNILRPFNYINPLFLALAISSGEPQKELAKKAQGKSVVHIHNSDIQEVSVLYPTRAEQDQIVAIFRKLDHLITLHQNRSKILKKIKDGLLQNLFI